MPGAGKSAKTAAQWRERLQQVAAGRPLGRGEHPPSGSPYRDVLAKISACPRSSGSSVDLFGRPVSCKCGFHPVSVRGDKL